MSVLNMIVHAAIFGTTVPLQTEKQQHDMTGTRGSECEARTVANAGVLLLPGVK